MKTEITEVCELDMDALSLVDFVNEKLDQVSKKTAVIKIQDKDGFDFEVAAFVVETFSDGSVGYSIRLGNACDFSKS